MSNLERMLVIAIFVVAAFASTGIGKAQGASEPPSPSPSPAATPTAVPDPCASLLSIVNRPTFGTGVCTVRSGHVLIENGYTNLVTTGPAGGNTATYPQSLVRIGTSDPHLDVEVGPIAENHSSVGGTFAAGLSDLAIGAKYEIGYSANADWGINAVVTIPTGATAFSAGN